MFEGLKLFIQNSSGITDPKLEQVGSFSDETGTYIVYKCLDNMKFYFSHLSKCSLLHSEAPEDMLKVLDIK